MPPGIFTKLSGLTSPSCCAYTAMGRSAAAVRTLPRSTRIGGSVVTRHRGTIWKPYSSISLAPHTWPKAGAHTASRRALTIVDSLDSKCRCRDCTCASHFTRGAGYGPMPSSAPLRLCGRTPLRTWTGLTPPLHALLLRRNAARSPSCGGRPAPAISAATIGNARLRRPPTLGPAGAGSGLWDKA